MRSTRQAIKFIGRSGPSLFIIQDLCSDGFCVDIGSKVDVIPRALATSHSNFNVLHSFVLFKRFQALNPRVQIGISFACTTYAIGGAAELAIGTKGPTTPVSKTSPLDVLSRLQHLANKHVKPTMTITKRMTPIVHPHQ